MHWVGWTKKRVKKRCHRGEGTLLFWDINMYAFLD